MYLQENPGVTGAVLLVRLKQEQRDLFSKLEEKRRFVDVQRDSVDKKLLQLQNLNYKRAYLKRQIKAARDHSIPAIKAVEDELGIHGGLTIIEYNESIDGKKGEILEELSSEVERRRVMRAELEAKEAELRTVIEILDKKRKFVEALPSKIGVILDSATEVKTSFENVSK